ncbi:MAG: hypothetical protein H6845_02745 [Alphaproteobacteria bacterium]|nr:MAG: hypothetical protein H6845_02745 [Alphaproteobacteria bacterium]
MSVKESLKFVQRWIFHPKQMGTFLPLPSKVGRILVSSLPTLSESDYILEIGSGTGALTKFLYHNPKLSKNLICAEIDSELCKILNKKFPDAKIINKSAADLDLTLDQSLLNRIKIIVSSVPFTCINQDSKDKIMKICSQLLNNGASMFHISYNPYLNLNLSSYGIKQIYKKRIFSIPMVFLHSYMSLR